MSTLLAILQGTRKRCQEFYISKCQRCYQFYTRICHSCDQFYTRRRQRCNQFTHEHVDAATNVTKGHVNNAIVLHRDMSTTPIFFTPGHVFSVTNFLRMAFVLFWMQNVKQTLANKASSPLSQCNISFPPSPLALSIHPWSRHYMTSQ
jgi:hypothetical protein